jgi:predicted RNA-binding protein YlxR (DUF448 family)
MPKKIPSRMCVACHTMKPKKELFRVVAGGDGLIFMDKSGKANGRGAYVCQAAECLAKAKKSKGLERALKQPVTDEVWNMLNGIIGDSE